MGKQEGKGVGQTKEKGGVGQTREIDWGWRVKVEFEQGRGNVLTT